MKDMNISFIGGALDGQNRTPINEKELSDLGYRIQIRGEQKGEELAHCIAVPTEWTPADGHKAILEKLSPKNNRNQL